MLALNSGGGAVAYQLAYPAPTTAIAAPTEQPYQGQIGTMEFYPSAAAAASQQQVAAAMAAYSGQQQAVAAQRRMQPAQQMFTAVRSRPM